MRFLATAAAGLTFALALAFAQADQSKLAFDVASVKPSAPGANGSYGMSGGPGSKDPGRIAYRNVSLRNVMVNAFAVQDDQITAPDWMGSVRFDIEATVPKDATKEQFQTMLQNLLAERFQLTLHREKKDFVVYELTVAKNGPKLKKSTPNPDAKALAPAPGGRGGSTDANGFPQPGLHSTAQRAVNGVALMAGNQITMTALANFLKFPIGFVIGNANVPGFSGRVVDKTGIDGEYDVTLEYQWPGGVPATQTGQPADPVDAPILFTAIQQQLGLKLEQTKVPLDVLVVDHAEKVPTEN